MSTPQALYRFFDANSDLLYVGISLNPGERWKQHRADKPWWIEVATVTVEHHADRASVAQAERDAIKAERPRYNIVHNFTVEGGERMASLLTYMPDPPARFHDPCSVCGEVRLPSELYPDDSSTWLAVYHCCGEKCWTKSVDQ